MCALGVYKSPDNHYFYYMETEPSKWVVEVEILGHECAVEFPIIPIRIKEMIGKQCGFLWIREQRIRLLSSSSKFGRFRKL